MKVFTKRAGEPFVIWIAIATAFIGFTALCYASPHNDGFLAEDFNQAWLYATNWSMTLHMFFPGSGGYRPFMYVFWYAGNLFWGYQPLIYHLVVFALHMTNGLFLFAIARQLSGRLWVGIVAGFVFLSLATGAEALNWLSSASNEVTCAFGYLLALLSLVRLAHYEIASGQRPLRYYFLCTAGLVIALLTNEIGMTWPLVALIVYATLRHHRNPQPSSVTPLGRSWWHRTMRTAQQDVAATVVSVMQGVRLLRPFLLLWALFIVWRTIAVRGIGGYGADVHLRAGWFLIADAWTYISYYVYSFAGTEIGARFFQWILSDYWLGGAGLVFLAIILWPVRWSLLATFILVLPALNIPSLYRGYMGGIGVGLVIAFGLCFLVGKAPTGQNLSRRIATMFKPVVAILVVAIILFAEITGAQARSQKWATANAFATDIIDKTVQAIPQPQDGAHIYFFNLRDTIDDTYIFTWGLREALQARYNNRTLDIFTIYPKPNAKRVSRGLEVTLDQIDKQAGYPQVFLVYQEGQSMDDRSLRQVSAQEFKGLFKANEGLLP